ncbi:MAG: XRE family transcriptional regulator, partial [Lachnospiraceae bacterium]|nr:XRE family transcriptional regulator [Lachnospiraceae bacterium]
MKMIILKSETRICPCCMEEHEVKTVSIKEQATFKERQVNYDAVYTYCDAADELYMDEHQLQENDIRLKDAYRRAEGLLTSDEISGIRVKYGITQSDLCT